MVPDHIMAKRNAQSELNHDNWDQEDESEEAGEFKKASEDQMKVGVVLVRLIWKINVCRGVS